MEITRNTLETGHGPAEWFTGTVYLDTIAAPSGTSRASAVRVHFTPGARTAWHTHPHGQTIYILEGIGRAQRRGGPVEVLVVRHVLTPGCGFAVVVDVEQREMAHEAVWSRAVPVLFARLEEHTVA